jgi:quinol-cytochrome oxidoreductase complex cytochrome b subunit
MLETVFDWITIAIFGALIILFLDRSMQDEPNDQLWHYLIAAVGCAAANYLGNEGYKIASIAVIAVVVAFIIQFLKPFDRFPRH